MSYYQYVKKITKTKIYKSETINTKYILIKTKHKLKYLQSSKAMQILFTVSILPQD